MCEWAIDETVHDPIMCRCTSYCQNHNAVMTMCWFGFYVLATSEVISGWTLTCDSAHSVQLDSAAQLGDQATGNINLYPTQSYYPGIELTSPSPYPVNAEHQAR